jgi:hypothetical protein
MANILQIRKVTELPNTLQPSTIYFIVDVNNLLTIYLTDKLGTISYTNYNGDTTLALLNTLLNSVYNQPNGLLKLNAQGFIDPNYINKINGGSVDISESGTSLYRLIPDRLRTSGGTTPSAVNSGSLSGLAYSGTLSTNQAFFDFVIPFDYDGVTPLIFRIFYWHPAANASSVEADFTFDYTFSNPYIAQAAPTAQTTINFSIIGTNVVNQVGVVTITLPNVPSDCVPGGIVRARIMRLGAGATDTNNNTVALNNVGMIYKFKKIGTTALSPPF